MSGMILDFTSHETTLARAGGKGANLASLAQAGFPVPPGFIVTTDAYRAFVATNKIESHILALVGSVEPENPNALDETSEKIQALFSAGTLPPDILESVRLAYTALVEVPDPPVAVRSSATAEDLPGLSFAGQQDTYLNIVGINALLEAVKACWASLWTARAIGYRARNHIDPTDIALAVVVQQMVPSEVSGILFTANPLTGHRGEMVIDASFGLGEAIVSGQVEPDHYVVDSHTMQIRFRKLGAKALAILPKSQGGTESISQQRPHEQALSDAQILELTRTAGEIARHFGEPQDIEWAWAGGHLSLLQSRPITSLYPIPQSFLDSDTLRILFSLNSLQGVVEPITPLGQGFFTFSANSFVQVFGTKASGKDLLIVAGGRLYLDQTGLLTDQRLRVIGLEMLANADPGAHQAAQTLIESGRIPTRSKFSRTRILRLMIRIRTFLLGVALAWTRPAWMRRRSLTGADRYLAGVQQALDAADSLDGILSVVENYGNALLPRIIGMGLLPTAIAGVMAQFITDHFLHTWIGTETGTVRKLLRGLPGNPTIEMDLTLWATAQAIRNDTASYAALQSQAPDIIAGAYRRGDLPDAAQQAVQAFMAQYGMRTVREIDLGIPRWREAPQALIQNIQSYLHVDDPTLGPDQVFRRAGAEGERLSAQYLAQVRQKKGPFRARLLGLVMYRMRLLSGFREMPKFILVKLLDLFRKALLDSGQQLVIQDRLENAEDIFLIPFDTLRRVAKGESVDLKTVVQQERQEYSHELARRQIPRLILSTGETFYQGMSQAGVSDLVGDGVSPGSVEGKVRIVEDPRGVRLEPGEILVCPATDPGWTPLFLSAGGLVMELGGMMTHGSVVAREYGIPAVVGVHEATRRLKTGQRVRVDGSMGRVIVLSETAVD